MKNYLFLFLIIFSLSGFSTEIVVKTEDELKNGIKKAKPGDTIIMSNGTWENIKILFKANGTVNNPITLKAEENGKVQITKQSNLRISGENLIVKGLVFTNGYSPTGETISFRQNSTTLANNCKITQCVIDDYNGPKKNEVEAWVVLYGKNNQVDHCQFLKKRNKGVTLVVRLNTPESVENNHIIKRNYFGPRENLGTNGGETLRIGTSHYSMMNSKTLVEDNYFNKCNGEIEIISNKSNKNTYRGNTFFECQGTLTLRHGNETLVENNIFLANQIANTGGIRIINKDQTVRNNYIEGTTGNGFRGAITVMNGVPNSPLNRYVAVSGALIENNSIINCASIELGAGSDKERSIAPSNSKIINNFIYSETTKTTFGVYDNISELTFKNNCLSYGIKAPTKTGFTTTKKKFYRDHNGLVVTNNGTGAKITGTIATKENTGVNWYYK